MWQHVKAMFAGIFYTILAVALLAIPAVCLEFFLTAVVPFAVKWTLGACILFAAFMACERICRWISRRKLTLC